MNDDNGGSKPGRGYRSAAGRGGYRSSWARQRLSKRCRREPQEGLGLKL